MTRTTERLALRPYRRGDAHDLAREANKKVFAIMALLTAAKGTQVKAALERAARTDKGGSAQ